MQQGIGVIGAGTQIARQFGAPIGGPQAAAPLPEPPGGDVPPAVEPPFPYGPGAAAAPPVSPTPGVEPAPAVEPPPGAAAAPAPPYAPPAAPPSPAPAPPPAPYSAPAGYGAYAYGGAPADPLHQLLQALQQRQVPPLPGAASPAGYPPPTAPAPNATALLRLILGNPQFQYALQGAAVGHPAARTVHLPMPAVPGLRGRRAMPIPLGAVMNAISLLAGQSMAEINAGTTEDEPEVPEYLVDEQGEFIVDPASAENRAALVGLMFQLHGAAEDAGLLAESDESDEGEGPAGVALDETEQWALEAGFFSG